VRSLEPGCRAESEVGYAAAGGLRIHDFGDECVAFDPLSWDAHLLNPSATAVLDLLSEGPYTEMQVEMFLADALLPDERNQARDHTRRLIDELMSLGLIHPISGQEGAVR
jgi:PqqD family protein of HPr-rel-A system